MSFCAALGSALAGRLLSVTDVGDGLSLAAGTRIA